MIKMEMKLKKNIKNLQKEVIFKFVDFKNDIEDFELKAEAYESHEKCISISPRCIRCNLCVEECPVNAITSGTFTKIPKIQNNCVKCEICVKTCPISCIYLMEATSSLNEENNTVEYFFNKKIVGHRHLSMKKIEFFREKCLSCGTCTKFCPTNAISLFDKSIIEAGDNKSYPNLKNREYPYIKKSLCIGCGSCTNLCLQNVIHVQRTLGPIIETKKLNINHDSCVGCSICEENCPVEAIFLEKEKVILDNKSCIKCNLCSRKCPVNALSLQEIDD